MKLHSFLSDYNNAQHVSKDALLTVAVEDIDYSH